MNTKKIIRITIFILAIVATLVMTSKKDQTEIVNNFSSIMTFQPVTKSVHNQNAFLKSKRLLERKVYNSNVLRRTFYCRCPYSNSKRIFTKKCGFSPRNRSRRSFRVEWEHIVPASTLGRNLPCWKNGGRKNCRRKSVLFNNMEADMNNLVPSVGEINIARLNYPFGVVRGENRVFGKCDFEIGIGVDNKMVAEPARYLRGNVARKWLYMIKKYRIPITNKYNGMLLEWHRVDPVSKREKELDLKIKAIQGYSNPYIYGKLNREKI